jgi:hypothetical protein
MGFKEEAILSELIERYKPKKFLVDIGARETFGSNVWRLLVAKSWRGVLVEQSKERCRILSEAIKEYRLVNRVSIKRCWASPININEIITGDTGLLSIDIDGQDYYVWEALKVRPHLVVIEYNPLRFGVNSIMKREDGYNWKKDETEDRLAFGASKEAMITLGRSKNYELVNFTDYNLFFLSK